MYIKSSMMIFAKWEIKMFCVARKCKSGSQLSEFWSGHVSSSLWSNVSGHKSLVGHSAVVSDKVTYWAVGWTAKTSNFTWFPFDQQKYRIHNNACLFTDHCCGKCEKPIVDNPAPLSLRLPRWHCLNCPSFTASLPFSCPWKSRFRVWRYVEI